MITIDLLLAIIITHYIADFVFQTRDEGENKHKDNSKLATHILKYGICFIPLGLEYAVINAALHYATDWYTSKVSHDFFAVGNMRGFWNTIGADQAIHMTALILTIPLMAPIWM